ncbi:MAG: molecular chaperone DnaJ [Chthoniobacterales bacterium]
MSKRDYYEILGVARTAQQEEIKRAYRKLAIKYHPDKNPGDAAAEASFKELAEAYDVISNPDKRAAYDRYGHAAFQGGGGRGAAGGFHDPFDLFREMFAGQAAGGGMGGGIFEQFFQAGNETSSRDGKKRGSDLRYDLQITLEEAFSGCEKEIEIQKLDTCNSCNGTGAAPGAKISRCSLCQGRGQVVMSRGFFQVVQTCPQCHGSGQVIDKPCKTCRGEGCEERTSRINLKIPAGIDEGARLRSSGAGEAGVRGGGKGDLYVIIHLKKHPVFERDDMDLHCQIPIPFSVAALGGEVKVPTLCGPVDLKIAAGTQSASTFCVRGSGMPSLQNARKGDLYVRVEVEVPTKLNPEQRQALEKFSQLCGEENTPLHRSFTERLKDFLS